jgi:bacterioferritin
MRVNEIEQKLRWFYTLELEQIDIYERQSEHIKDDYIKRVLNHFISIERNHVKSFLKQFEMFDFKPKRQLGAILTYMGEAGGTATAMAGVSNMLKADMLLEQKALKEYNKFIEQLEKSSIRDEKVASLISTLQSNSIDEELHIFWCKGKIEEFKDKNS